MDHVSQPYSKMDRTIHVKKGLGFSIVCSMQGNIEAFDALQMLDGLNKAAMNLAFNMPLPDFLIPG